jgi:hypothetical protein
MLSLVQRSHWYVKSVGFPSQDPLSVSMGFPTRSDPVTLGTPVFLTGAAAGVGEGGAGGGATADEAELTSDAEPPAFDAVTLTRRVEPTSVLVSAY